MQSDDEPIDSPEEEEDLTDVDGDAGEHGEVELYKQLILSSGSSSLTLVAHLRENPREPISWSKTFWPAYSL